MSKQGQRHYKRQPTEEAIRIAVSEFVGNAGTVDVQRMSYDWRADDLLVQIQLREPLSGSTLSLFRRELSRTMESAIPADDLLQDWLVLIECAGQTIGRVAPYDRPEDAALE